MTENPYESPGAVVEVQDRTRRNPFFWCVFACTAMTVLAIDACLFPQMIPAQKDSPMDIWALINLPGMPIVLITAKRGYGEPLRQVLKSAGCASIHWGTLAGFLACAYSSRNWQRLSTLEIGVVLALNVLIPALLVVLVGWLVPDPP
jgi:hypothetical protein